jgi:hypothetical protein
MANKLKNQGYTNDVFRFLHSLPKASVLLVNVFQSQCEKSRQQTICIKSFVTARRPIIIFTQSVGIECPHYGLGSVNKIGGDEIGCRKISRFRVLRLCVYVISFVIKQEHVHLAKQTDWVSSAHRAPSSPLAKVRSN